MKPWFFPSALEFSNWNGSVFMDYSGRSLSIICSIDLSLIGNVGNQRATLQVMFKVSLWESGLKF
jgi:hypothetical protein